MSPSESRARLAELRSRALAAGLTSAVAGVDIRLTLAATHAIRDLERALAELPAPDPLTVAHAVIVADPDASTASPASPITPPRKPVLGEAKTAPAQGVLPKPKQPPAAVRGPTGPDKWDLEIPV
jgi:hypothetical protein